MKIKKDQLKLLIKECIIEVLAESLVNNQGNRANSLNEENLSNNEKSSLQNEFSKRTLGNVIFKNDDDLRNRQNKKLNGILPPQLKNNNINNRRKLPEHVINATSDDPVMQEIMSHTYNTTFVEQAGARGSVGLDSAGIDINSLFSNEKNNWANIAFSDKKIN